MNGYGETASKIKDTAQAKALSLKVDSMMRRLGEAVFADHNNEENGSDELIRQVREFLSQIEEAQGQIHQHEMTNQGRRITPRRILYVCVGTVTLLMLLAMLRNPEATAIPGIKSASPDGILNILRNPAQYQASVTQQLLQKTMEERKMTRAEAAKFLNDLRDYGIRINNMKRFGRVESLPGTETPMPEWDHID